MRFLVGVEREDDQGGDDRPIAHLTLPRPGLFPSTDRSSTRDGSLDRCGSSVAQHQQVVMAELQQFQGRVQRCVQACQDKQSGTSPDQAAFDRCVSECAVFYQKELGQLRPKLLKKP